MKTALSLGVITATNIAIAFFTQWFTVVVLGPGRDTDALFAGSAIPQLILAVVSGSLTHVLVPLFASEERESARREAWRLIAVIGGAFAAAALVLVATAHLWAPLLFPGFEGSSRLLLIKLARIQLIGMAFTGVSGIVWAFCHSQRQFVRAELTQLFSAALTFALLFVLLRQYGVTAAAWLSVARSGLSVALLISAVGRPLFHGTSQIVTEVWRRLRPLLIGTTYYKTDPLLDRLLSSMAPAGILSLLYLGMQMFTAATQVINSALAAPLVPQLAAAAKAQDWPAFVQAYRKRLVWIATLTTSAYAGFLLVGRPFLELLIGHGGVTLQNVETLWKIMAALAGVLVFGALGQVTSVVFYSVGDTTTPTRLGIITYTIYIPLKVAAFLKYGVIALAVATSAFVFINVVIQFVLIERRFKSGRTANAQPA